MHLRDSFDCAAVFLFICDASGGRRDVHGNFLADHNVHHAPRFPEACGSGPVSYIVSAEREALMPFSSITDSERLSVVNGCL